MPRALRLSVAAAGVLVLVSAPAATAAPSDATTTDVVSTSEEASTTTAAPTTTTAAPTTTPRRYVAQRDSSDQTPTTTSVTATTTAAPTTVSPSPQATTEVTTTTSTPSARAGTFETAAQARAGLSITVAGRYGTIVPSAKSASGTLTLISVTATGGVVGSPVDWTATASSTDFVGPNGFIPKSGVTYTATAIAGNVGGSTSTPTQTLDTPKTVVARTGSVWPSETVTWTPALRVDYPGGAAIGAYTGTITISVA
ncbi:hypothetical protein [Prescottella agglutinans]|nr:hypothetical protein [Prescottella agglutinans]